jgi:hypothetical protein
VLSETERRDRFGRRILMYCFWSDYSPGLRPLFEGDFAEPYTPRKDETLRSVLGLLTLQPEAAMDIDLQRRFEDFTEEQLRYANSPEAELHSLWALDDKRPFIQRANPPGLGLAREPEEDMA